MAIKANGLLKFAVPLAALLAMALAVRACHNTGNDGSAGDQQAKQATQVLTPAERKELGVEADTPKDTVATLVGQIHAMRNQLEESQAESQQLRKQNKNLAAENRNTKNVIHQALSDQQQQQRRQRSSMMRSMEAKIAQLRRTINSLGDDQANNDDMPVGLGLNDETPEGAAPSLTWVAPLEAQATGGGDDSHGSDNGQPSAFATAFDTGKGYAQAAGDRADRAIGGGGHEAAQGAPVYTVPKSSTLVGSVGMTALLGRVPIDGTVQDPYPFKVVIGPENLTANGIELPELKGAIVSGNAVGDWTLSCVRGKVKSITFVFQDGRIRTVPESATPGEGDKNDDEQIGYLSNPAGVPCIPGTRKTNARSYILTQVLLSAGAAGANAYSGKETETSVSAFGKVTGVTGDFGKYIAGSAVSSGLNEVREWLQKRFGQTFDAIYAPPGQPVAVNITKEIPIDYEYQGRKVHYVHAQPSHGLD